MGAERSHQAGMIICAASVFAAFVFLIGVMRRSYMALALPVTAGFLGGLYIALLDRPRASHDADRAARRRLTRSSAVV